MGFFSWECKKCGKSIRSAYAVTKAISWMMQAVLLTKNGSVIKGEYDGYGRILNDDGDEFEIECENPCMYHEKCWKEAGKPEYDSPSKYAQDQGFFVGEEEDEDTVAESLDWLFSDPDGDGTFED